MHPATDGRSIVDTGDGIGCSTALVFGVVYPVFHVLVSCVLCVSSLSMQQFDPLCNILYSAAADGSKAWILDPDLRLAESETPASPNAAGRVHTRRQWQHSQRAHALHHGAAVHNEPLPVNTADLHVPHGGRSAPGTNVPPLVVHEQPIERQTHQGAPAVQSVDEEGNFTGTGELGAEPAAGGAGEAAEHLQAATALVRAEAARAAREAMATAETEGDFHIEARCVLLSAGSAAYLVSVM